MLKGLEVSEVKWSDVKGENGELRIDAEYFQKEYLNEDINLSKIGIAKLGEYAFVTDGQHGYYESDPKSRISMLAARNCKNYFADKIDALPLAKWVDDNNKRSSLQHGDIILSTRGSVGCCAIVYDEVLPANINQDVARIKLNDSNSFVPEFVITYLNCKYGQNWMLRNQTGMVQQGLPLDKVRTIPLPLLSTDFQQKIESLAKSAHAKLAESKALYSQAEDTLLSELGLKDWQPKTESVSIKTFSDFASSGRLDAEFYQQKYDELEGKIKSVPYKAISELQTFNARGVQPDYISNGSVSVVNSKHILENGLDYENFEKTTTDFLKDNEKAAIKQNDILIYTTGANIGRTQPYLLSEPAIASNHVNILRLNEVNPLYAAFVLNSKIGRLQTEKACTGSAQAELYPSDIENFLLPILSEKTQDTIANLIQKSFELRAESKQLLEQAKQMVEAEIEK